MNDTARPNKRSNSLAHHSGLNADPNLMLVSERSPYKRTERKLHPRKLFRVHFSLPIFHLGTRRVHPTAAAGIES
jgi:hypothetical protein